MRGEPRRIRWSARPESPTPCPSGASPLCVRQGWGQPSVQSEAAEGNSAQHTPGRHFVTRIYPSKPIRKKEGKKRPRRATAHARRSLASPHLPPAGKGRHAAHAPSCFETVHRETCPSHACARACAHPMRRPRGKPAAAAGVCGRWSRVARRRRLRRWARVAAVAGRG